MVRFELSTPIWINRNVNSTKIIGTSQWTYFYQYFILTASIKYIWRYLLLYILRQNDFRVLRTFPVLIQTIQISQWI